MENMTLGEFLFVICLIGGFVAVTFLSWLGSILADSARNGNVEGFTHIDNADDN